MMIRYLIFILTNDCNLNCIYCYRGNQSKQQAMTVDMITECIEKYMQHDSPCHVQLTGGEPTLRPELIEHTAQFIRKKKAKASIAIQTNATLLDESLIKMFQKYQIQVGVSLDGPLDIQEKLRGNASETFKGLKRLECHEVPFRVTTVVSQQNIEYLHKTVLLLSSFSNALGIGLDLLIQKGRAKNAETITPATPDVLEKSIKQMLVSLDAINLRRHSKLRFREKDTIVNAHKIRQLNPFFCHAAKNESLCVTPDGFLYPCSQTAGDERFVMGTIEKPNKSKPLLLKDYALSHHNCDDCSLTGFCPGDCYSRQFYNNNAGQSLTCVMYQKILNHMRK
ncbi:MAG: radical SAM domain-containing protein [Candidatus Magnetoglobus multicellularis str. Araruama]|uniref:Radical SAM domain-containing protein n=1 Tax=Candidatus Magnetoglobus multicellularis str. Araruama TaxID=890399 RepID=A0A1V1P9R5_9BACT|nr:MAG: radical SAM domain-containing protein [Candidatus Magnetoglobus multicellularis str. Araruama]